MSSIDQATEQLLDRGIRVLNANLLGDTERAHVERLLELMAPPQDATVLDAGCGVGEVARLMAEARPDLSFKLLNLSKLQLAHCPPGMELLHADFNAIPLADESVDVVMFNYALCHAHNWLTVLCEARRVLREGGILFINDMVRSSGSNLLMNEILDARVFPPRDVHEVALRAGFDCQEALGHVPAVLRLREVFDSPQLYDTVFAGVVPATFRFQRKTVADPVASAFARHQRIAFQFSGGRDSTAALYLLRPYWDRMTVYHLDTGDQFPETRAVVERVEQDVPITRIYSDVAATRREFGLASDLVPVDNSEVGRLVSGRPVKIISRYECCARTLMNPMHERMGQDGITLIVRGQRDDEYATPPKRSGDTGGNFEVLYPIQSWSGEQVSAYLKDNDLPIAPFYERGARRAPECMGCTAWWDEGRAGYMREYHPEAFVAYSANMKVIRIEIDRQYGMLEGYSQRNLTSAEA